MSKDEEHVGPSSKDQAGADEEHQVAPNTENAKADDEHQAEQDDQGTENPNEQVASETYGAGPSAANADEYAMHALVGYEPPIDCGIPMSPFERLKINCLDNMVNNQRNHYEFYVARFQHLDEQIEVVQTQRFEYGKDD